MHPPIIHLKLVPSIMGEHIHNGHDTALIFDQDKVLEVDDEQAFDRTANWKEHAESTVYLAFYIKHDDYNNKTAVKTHDKRDSNIRENQDDNESAIK